MLSLNISCPVCKEIFKTSDTIYTTNCGHVFHFFCINKWISQYTSCPQCKSHNPTTHGIYLNFDNSCEFEKVVTELKQKLNISKDENKKMQEELLKKVNNIKRLYNISEQWRGELQDKLSQFTVDNEERIRNHSKEMDLQLNELQSLKSYIEKLEEKEEAANLVKKNNEFSIENTKLKKTITESETTNIILNQKIEMQNQRIKLMNTEFQKHIAESLNKEPEVISIQMPPQQRNSKRNRRKDNNNSLGEKDLTKVAPESVNGTLQKSTERKAFQLKQPNDCRVIIVDFPKDNLLFPLENTIVLLANQMSVSLQLTDIKNVNVIDPKNYSVINKKIAIAVEFKNIDTKVKFLTYKNRLKHHTITKSVLIKEYISEDVYPLFRHANRRLREIGYISVCCKDNKVYARKKIDTEEILIRNMQDIDSLLICQAEPLVRTNDITGISPKSLMDVYRCNGYF